MKPLKKNQLDRRAFLELSAKSAAVLGLATMPGLSCIATEEAATKTVFGGCYHDCPDRCSWKVTTRGKEVVDFKGSDLQPYTNGSVCGKMTNFPSDVTFHPDRILTPLKRTGAKGSGSFEAIGWEQAIQEVASKLQEVIRINGGEAILPFSFGGNQGLIQGESLAARFFAKIGASRLDRTICGNAAVEGILAANGQTTGVLPEDIIHSRYIVLWGTNPVLSNQHLWPLIEQARNKGAKLVTVDPFLSKTAEQSDWHIQPMPGTDTALALGLMHVIVAEDLQDQDYIDRYSQGFEQLKAHIQKYDPATVAAITGLENETIRTFAREYATASPSLIRTLIGMEHQQNGASAFRAVAMLPALTGAWRQFGGGQMNMTYELFGDAINWQSFSLPQQLAEKNNRTINMIELGKALQNEDLQPPVKALFVYNANPAVTAPNQNLVLKGLERADLLTVVSEHFITDTARYADYIFPSTTVLEHWDLFDSWGTSYLTLNEPAIPPVGQAKTNTELFRLLSKAMGLTEEYLFEKDLDMVKNALKSDHPYMDCITFEYLRANGAVRLKLPEKWMPHAEGNFGTPSGKCHFYDANLEQPVPDYVPFDFSREEVDRYPLQLLSIKSTKYFLNSSHANVAHLLEKEGKMQLDMHPEDAVARNISNGDELKVYNQRGRVIIRANISKKVKKGVVCMPQGYWASLVKGGSTANALTHDQLTDMGRGGAFQNVRVEVERS